ncbi:P8 [Ectromelia virus]|uniref:Virion membrane protein OPG139 n=4 Tax=Ectromelia virus TaxID=12643 RepID=Q912N0_9POXV|nr:EVM116 [Ectromelia virus]AFH54679.1 virion maturation protein [Ectromelia virus ERPV]AIF30200.1 EVN134 [Ectromelia virus Naval]QSV39705.1 IMV membrane protein [Ectromelia virus WH]AAM92420.1 EVM116 [Ectromelia virus]AUO16277.1 P8 [Ectromelia virus]
MIGILLLIGICVAVTVAILYALYNKIKSPQNPDPNPPPPEPRNTKFVNNLEKDHISSLYNLVKSSA